MKKLLILIIFLVGGYLIFLKFWPSTDPSASDTEKQKKIIEMYDGYKRFGFAKANDLTVEEILDLEESKDLIFVDVREKEEQDVSMIPNAIPYLEFENLKDRFKDKTIITYCTIGSRSGDYTEQLSREGFDAYNMAGSILSWAHEGQPLVHEGKETNRVHVYGKKWDLLPEGYEPVY